MKKYLMTLLTLGLACNAAACMEDEPFYDTEIPPHASIDNSKGEGVTRLVTYNVGIFNKYIKDDYQLIADMMKEIDADAILLAKNIDGVYDSDPAKNADAVKFDAITYDEVLKRHLAVMDSTATSMSMDNHIPVLVFALKDPYNIVRAVRGEKIGTIVKED